MLRTTASLWALLVLAFLLVATAVIGTAFGLIDGEGDVLGARLLLSALRPWSAIRPD
jgi:hypothetical protein